MSSCRHKGKAAEQLVVSYLRRQGWTILATNYKRVGAEIDIIAKDKGTLVFIEVKSGRQGGASLAESVNLPKRRRIERAAEHFLYHNNIHTCPIRFDIVTVTMPLKRIQHFREEFFDF